MAAAFDPYEALGIRRGATQDEIRAAYKRQVARYHPDKHKGNPLEDLAAAKLLEINRAYEVLTDAGESAPSRGASEPARQAAPARARPDPWASLMRTAGSLVALILFVRFGLAFGGQLLALLRGVTMGLLWVVRASPVLAVVVLVIALASGFAAQRRKGGG